MSEMDVHQYVGNNLMGNRNYVDDYESLNDNPFNAHQAASEMDGSLYNQSLLQMKFQRIITID